MLRRPDFEDKAVTVLDIRFLHFHKQRLTQPGIGILPRGGLGQVHRQDRAGSAHPCHILRRITGFPRIKEHQQHMLFKIRLVVGQLRFYFPWIGNLCRHPGFPGGLQPDACQHLLKLRVGLDQAEALRAVALQPVIRRPEDIGPRFERQLHPLLQSGGSRRHKNRIQQRQAGRQHQEQRRGDRHGRPAPPCFSGGGFFCRLEGIAGIPKAGLYPAPQRRGFLSGRFFEPVLNIAVRLSFHWSIPPFPSSSGAAFPWPGGFSRQRYQAVHPECGPPPGGEGLRSGAGTPPAAPAH